MFLLLVTLAQAPRYTTGWGDAAVVASAGVVTLVPVMLRLPHGPAPCAPCDPATLPALDRWVVGLDSRTAVTGSNVLLAGVVGYGLIASVHGVSADRARGDAAVYVQGIAWTQAATGWLKVIAHRSRPVLYTSQAAAAAAVRDNRESFPSGHTSTAFAAATVYAVMAHRQRLPHATRNAVVLYAGAAGVGSLRVAGGRHFPTDVLAGAALGSAVGWLVAAVHPRTAGRP